MWSVHVFQRVEESQAQDGQEGEDRKAAAGQGLLGRQGDWIQVQAAAINEKFFCFNQCCGSKYIKYGSGSRFWPNLDPYPGPDLDLGLCYFFLKKNIRIRIWIYKAPEYGFNTDPDPQH